MVNSKIFEVTIIVLIVFSTLTLAFESPLDDPKGTKIQVLEKIDLVMTFIFTCEAVLKIIAYGFLFNGKESYMKSAWNVLDFTIVVSALISLAFDYDLQFLKALRILRVLRPLRLIKRVPGLKIAILSLFNALPSILKLLVVVLFFMYSFAILLTTFLSG